MIQLNVETTMYLPSRHEPRQKNKLHVKIIMERP